MTFAVERKLTREIALRRALRDGIAVQRAGRWWVRITAATEAEPRPATAGAGR